MENRRLGKADGGFRDGGSSQMGLEHLSLLVFRFLWLSTVALGWHLAAEPDHFLVFDDQFACY